MALTPDQAGVDDPGQGRRLGLDVGTVRIGVALSDSAGILAHPVETVARVTKFKDLDGDDIDRILELVEINDVVEIVIGLPRNLNTTGSISVRHAKDIGFRLRRRLHMLEAEVPIRFHDERLTTVTAQRNLHECGFDTRRSRSVIDQEAAVVILQGWLDARARYLAQD